MFLIYINDLRVNNNEQVNHDLEILANLLKTSKISLNVGKTELLLFTSPKKQLDCDLKIKLNGKRLYETHSVKYLGIQIGKSTTWKQHLNRVTLKLNKGIAMLSKLRHVSDIKTLRPVYYAIFEYDLCCASLVWAQNTNSVKKLHLIQKKSLRIMFFKSRNSHTGPLFQDFKILKSLDKTGLKNCNFISKSLKKLLPPVFSSWFNFFFESHLMILVCKILVILKYHTKTYTIYS